MDLNVIEARKGSARAWFETLRDRLVAAFEEIEDALPAGAPLWSVRFQGVRTKRPAVPVPCGGSAGRASSSSSNAATIRSRKVSNQARARCLRISNRSTSMVCRAEN